MPKAKTHSGASKRFRLTGTGKVLRQKANRRHLLEHKPTKRTRRLDGRTEVLTTHEIQAGMRRVIGRFADLKTLDGVLNLTWNAGQMHRLARGQEPDLNRGALASALSMLRRNGRVSLKPRRGVA